MSATTNSWLKIPVMSNGIGTISVVGLPTTVTSWSGFDYQVSSNGIDSWVTLTNVVFPLAGIWTNYDIVINSYTPTYFRFLKKSDNGGASYYCFDQVIVHHPPTRVSFTNVVLVPSPAYSNASFNFTVGIQSQGIISNLTVTNFYRIGTSGPWTALGMASNGPSSWITTNPVPGQLPGSTVQFVFNAYFQGPDAMSPTSYPTVGTSAPLSFVVKSYPLSDYLPTSMSVFGALSTNMILVRDYTWEAFLESPSTLTNVGIRWQGVPNFDSNTTNTWGENDQDDFVFRLEGVAESGGGDVILPGTNSGQFVLTFNETNGDYILNHGYWENFDAWDYTTTSRVGWISTNGLIITDPARILRNNSLCLASSNSVRSPYLQSGIGEIVVSYRNYQTNGLPVASLRIQRSATGSDNDADWLTLTNILNITTTDYVRAAFTIEDRNSRYVRIQNTSTNGRVALDEIQIYDAYYSGVVISNLTLSPISPTATNPVTVSLDIQPFSGASDIQATLYYRLGGETTYSSITLTNTSGFTYSTATPIPGNLVPDYWGYRVEYYIRCTFAGDQSSMTSPVDVPAGGSNNPAFYTIQSDIARVTLINLTQTYNGSNRIVTASTIPTGLVVDITYDGNMVPPVNAGSYFIVGTVNDADLQGTQTGTLLVAKANQNIIFPNPGAQFTNSTVILHASASSGLPVAFGVTRGPGIITAGTQLTFSASGSVSIVATQAGDLNWNPAPQWTNTFNVSNRIALVTLNNLSQTYNGSNRIVTASTLPPGLVVDITYDGDITSPINAGSYAVVGSVNDAVYQGSQIGTLVVAKANQMITFTNPGAQFQNSTVSLHASASSGLPIFFSVASGPGILTSGAHLVFNGTGVVTIVATQAGDDNWNSAQPVTNQFEVIFPQDRAFFRIMSSTTSVITAFNPYGSLVWSNAAIGGTGWVQRATTLIGPSNWTDYITFTVTGTLMVLPIVVETPITEYLVVDLSDGPSASSYPVSYLYAVPPGGWSDEYKTTKMVFRRIPAGTFMMGSPVSELGQIYTWGDETRHQVTLTQPFYIGIFEVTQMQWERVMGTWPSYFNNATYYASRPVERVSYYQIRENPNNIGDSAVNWPTNSLVNANSFMGKLRSRTGKAFDLPTESQWEYAGRAGMTTALNSGFNLTDVNSDTHLAKLGRFWYNGGSDYTQNGNTSVATAKVGSYLPNAWGLYDIHGNVWEWCLDWYGAYPGTVSDPKGATTGSYRVFRGGGWGDYAGYCRSASRGYNAPYGAYETVGFRVALPSSPADAP